jgi:hypothetical protein
MVYLCGICLWAALSGICTFLPDRYCRNIISWIPGPLVTKVVNTQGLMPSFLYRGEYKRGSLRGIHMVRNRHSKDRHIGPGHHLRIRAKIRPKMPPNCPVCLRTKFEQKTESESNSSESESESESEFGSESSPIG